MLVVNNVFKRFEASELSPIQSDFERVIPQWPNEVHAKGIFLNILKKYQLSSQSYRVSLKKGTFVIFVLFQF